MDSNMDFSGAIEKVKDMLANEDGQNQIQNILHALTSGSDNDNQADVPSDDNRNDLLSGNCNSQENASDSFDMDMFLRLQKIMSMMKTSTADKQTDLLKTLKPFLRQSRRDKLDSAVKFIKVLRLINQFRSINEGSD